MTEREALKMAIEFLEDNQHYVADNERHAYVMEYNNVIEKCKEALAQPEPGGVCVRCGGWVCDPIPELAQPEHSCVACEGNPKGNNNPCAVCGLAQPEQESVAITITGKLGNIYSFTGDYSLKKGDKVYTTPPQPEPVIDKSAATRIASSLGWEPKRKPLTPDQVFAIADQHPVEGFDPEIMAFARAIEAAHGIKEKNT